MQKSTIRNICATLAIFGSYVAVVILQRDKIMDLSNEFASFALGFAITSVIAGLVGGLIAPYTYKRAVLYVEITLVIPVIIGGIILISMGEVLGENQNSWAGPFILIIILIFALALAVFIVVTALGIFFGAWIGAKIGKTFTNDYRQWSAPSAQEPTWEKSTDFQL